MITDILRKPGLTHKLFLMALAMAFSVMSVIAANRYSVSSGNWGNPMIWSATSGGPPGASAPGKQDNVFIENSHFVTVTADIECRSLTFTGATATLTVDSPSTLTVGNSVTLNNLTNSNSECFLSGTGTLSCAWIDVGSETNPPPTDPSSSVYTHTFTSAIASLNLAVKGAPKNDLTINSYTGGTSHFRNGIFYQESGIVTIDGQIVTINPNAGNTSTFSMASGIQSGTLFLNGRPSPFILSGTGTNSINLNGTASLVNYCYAGPQTILATGYNNLTLSGSGVKTLSGVTVNGILSMEGTATAGGTTPVYNPLSTLQYKGSAAQVSGIEFPATFSGSGGIIIDNGAGLTLNSNRTISSKLTFINGRINTGVNTLSLTSPATVTGAGTGRYVNGNLLKGIAAGTVTKTFETGDASVYAPVNLSFTGIINVEGSITARTTPGDHPAIASSTFNAGVTVNRYWTLTNTGVSGFISCDVTFNFVPSDIDPGADFHYFYTGNYNPAAWIYPPVGLLTSTSTQAKGITSFGDFQTGELPVSSFRSCQSGNWDQISSWEAFNGTIWTPATATPSSTAGYITIRSPHIITNTSAVTADQVIIDPGGRLNINSGMIINDGPAIDFSVNGTLDCSSGNLSGTGSFFLNNFADLIIRSPDGISISGASGNIQTSTRTFNPWSNYGYGGSVSQVTGNGLPQAVNNLCIDNPETIALTNPVIVNGVLTLMNGEFSLGTNILTLQTSDIPISRTAGTITAGPGSGLSFGSASDTLGAAFTIPPGTFTFPPELNTLSVYRTNGMTLNDQVLSVNGIVLCNGPLNTNGNLTLLSTPSATALIDGTGKGEITGHVTMQRYLPSAFGYKYVSSPFQAATVNEFGDDLDLTDPFPSFYRYDESSTTSGWVDYVTTTSLLNPLEGFAANFGSSAIPHTLDITGTVNNGPLSVGLVNHNNTYTQGFNLVGNPYPSPIDWNALTGWTKNNIDNALYYFKASSSNQYGGRYNTYVNGVSSNDTVSNIIPSMQGFFIHVSNGTFPVTATLGLDNPVRVTDLTHNFTKSGKKGHPRLLRLGASIGDDRKNTDPMVIYFDEKAGTGFDPDLDALKLMNTDNSVPNLYSTGTDGNKLSINALPECSDTLCRIPLGLRISVDGQVVFRIMDSGENFSAEKICIYDLATGTEHDLLNGKEYRVYLNADSYNGRFWLNLSPVHNGN